MVSDPAIDDEPGGRMRRLVKNTLLCGLLMTWVLITSMRMCGAVFRFNDRHNRSYSVPIGEGFADPGGAWHAKHHDDALAPQSIVDIVGAWLGWASKEAASCAHDPERSGAD